jgi:phosphoribosylformimino-5-aminoimidazole carboxamide ribotide isomerase
MELLPALDLRGGRAVRLRQGDPGRATVYDVDPAEWLAAFAAAGVHWAHVVDLDAAFGEVPQTALLAALAARSDRPRLQLGGGLRSRDAVAAALGVGFERLVLGSLVAGDPLTFGALARELPGRLVPAIDCQDGQVRVAGWRQGATRDARLVCESLVGLPCPALLVTDVDRDGMLAGPNLRLAQTLGAAASLPVLVSGGVRDRGDIEAARRIPGVAGVVVGRALLDGDLRLDEALAAAAGSSGAARREGAR